jgi:hypothetical protein
VQNHDQSGLVLEFIRHKRKHPEIARIGAEARDLDQWAEAARPQTPAKIAQMIESGQLGQAAEKIDIVGEGHRQLLGEETYNSTGNSTWNR